MSEIINTTNDNQYWVVETNNVISFGTLVPNQHLASDQTNLFIYNTEQEMIDKVNDLAGDPNYYNEVTSKKQPPSPEFIRSL